METPNAPPQTAEANLPEPEIPQDSSIHRSPAELQSRIRDLQTTAATLKSEFVGLDSQIDAILNALRPWYLLPETLQRPS